MKTRQFILLLIICFNFCNVIVGQDYSYIGKIIPNSKIENQKQGKESNKARKERINKQKKQTIDSLKNTDSKIIIKEIDKTLDIKDKIFIVNKSHSCINQLAIAIINGEGRYETICSMVKDVQPGHTSEIISFANNELKQLRGREIAVKIKGAVFSGKHEGIEQDNNINKPSSITYDYVINVYERRHDLYIEACLSTQKSHHDIMDF